jgi:hypothetical protein
MGYRAVVIRLAVAAAFGSMANSAAAVVLQFQAESAALTATPGWSDVANASALGGSVLQANGLNPFNGNTDPNGMATYSVNFPAAGTYDLYVRFAMAADGVTDSFFLADALGAAAPTIQENNLGFAGGPNGTLNGLPLVFGQTAALWQNIAAAGDMVWINFSANIREAVPGAVATNNEVPTYNVAAPGVQTFRIGTRENMMSIDALAFALSSEASNVRVGLDSNLFLFTGANTDFDGMNGPDLADFDILRSNYLMTGALQTDGDANADFVVNHEDFFLWRTDFLAGSGSLAEINWSPVPEPTTTLLLLTGGLAMASARRARRQS